MIGRGVLVSWLPLANASIFSSTLVTLSHSQYMYLQLQTAYLIFTLQCRNYECTENEVKPKFKLQSTVTVNSTVNIYKMKSRRRAAVEAKRSMTASMVGVSLRWTCRRISAFSRCSSIVLLIAVSVRSSFENRRSTSTVVTGIVARSCCSLLSHVFSSPRAAQHSNQSHSHYLDICFRWLYILH